MAGTGHHTGALKQKRGLNVPPSRGADEGLRETLTVSLDVADESRQDARDAGVVVQGQLLQARPEGGFAGRGGAAPTHHEQGTREQLLDTGEATAGSGGGGGRGGGRGGRTAKIFGFPAERGAAHAVAATAVVAAALAPNTAEYQYL